MPFIFKHVAAMPDVHVGLGSTIGSVIPTQKAIIPAAAGVDLGCGMMAVRTSLTAQDLPDNLRDMRLAIEKAVPNGRTGGRKRRDVSARLNTPELVDPPWTGFLPLYNPTNATHSLLAPTPDEHHHRTSRTVNHFVELCSDELDRACAMLYLGPPGVAT